MKSLLLANRSIIRVIDMSIVTSEGSSVESSIMTSASVESFDNLTRDDAGSLLGGMESVEPEEGIGIWEKSRVTARDVRLCLIACYVQRSGTIQELGGGVVHV